MNMSKYYIGLHRDNGDGVFCNDGIIIAENLNYLKGCKRLDDSNSDSVSGDDGIYQLTEEGEALYDKWAENQNGGYDLCNGRTKYHGEPCMDMGPIEFFNHLTSDKTLAVRKAA